MNEQWRAIPGFGDRYEASDAGRVRNKQTSRILKHAANPRGYCHLSLFENNVGTTVDVHRLVLLAFVGQCPTERPQTNHKDGNKANNSLQNLEYVSYGENMEHADKVLGAFPFRRVKHPAAKLSEAQVAEIKRRRAEGAMLKSLSKEFGISETHICAIAKGRYWKGPSMDHR